jgi:hypothetical protein
MPSPSGSRISNRAGSPGCLKPARGRAASYVHVPEIPLIELFALKVVK